MNDKPLTPDELKAKLADPNLKIVIADQGKTEDLWPQVQHILAVMADFFDEPGFIDAMTTDESCFSDFGVSKDELPGLGLALDCPLNPDNVNDHYLVRVAARLKTSW